MKGYMDVDFVLAVILFVTVYSLLYTMLPSMTISFRETPDPIATTSAYFSDELMFTPGIPANWTTLGQATRLGLTYGTRTISYPNILDINKIASIDGQDCATLRAKTDVTLNFVIIVESSVHNYSCSRTLPATARLIERVGYVKNSTNYYPAKMKLWTW